jgi:hypothetical protein
VRYVNHDDCETCEGYGTVVEYHGNPHNPYAAGVTPCPDCAAKQFDLDAQADARGQEWFQDMKPGAEP